MGTDYEPLINAVRRAVLSDEGTLPRDIREAALEYRDVPEDIQAYVTKVRERAYTVTDSDFDAMRAAGYSEDQLYELTICTALSAGLRRREIGLAAVREAR